MSRLFSIVFFLLFTANLYAAEPPVAFKGECTTSLSNGMTNQTKCSITEVFEGKTYCFGSETSKAAFLANPSKTIAQAEAFYAKTAEPIREKISQERALTIIGSKTCDLSNKDLSSLNFSKMSLGHCKMQNVSFFGTDLRGASLKGADLQGAFLNLARLENADLSETNLTNASIYQAIFDKTNFHGANLTNVRLIGPLGDVDMIGANVKNGQLGASITTGSSGWRPAARG